MASKIFVFGSNLLGLHGGGAAKHALDCYGAVLGQGEGIQGRSYAIPTKADFNTSLTVDQIAGHVHTFLLYAQAHPEQAFFVTAIGCGLAGHIPQAIAPLFAGAPANCTLPAKFTAVINQQKE